LPHVDISEMNFSAGEIKSGSSGDREGCRARISAAAVSPIAKNIAQTLPFRDLAVLRL
jgi:hypothetical protein